MIGIVGCGAMGSSMALRLLERGHDVLGFDASAEVRSKVAGLGVGLADGLAGLAQGSELIILSLPKAAIVDAVMAELGPLVRPGTVVLDASTSEPSVTRRLALAAAAGGYVFLDGPVSGGPAGARAGSMVMVLGGEAQAINSVRPILADLTGKIVHVGPSGSGHAAKIANNLLCAANLVLVSEMGRLAEASGVELAALLEGVNAGSGRSGVSEVNFPKWILSGAFDSGFTMGLMRKDVALASDLAARSDLDLPATSAIAEIWARSVDELPDGADFNEIFKLRDV